MEKTEILVIGDYFIPLPEIRYIERNGNGVSIYLKNLAFPLNIEDISFDDLIRDFRKVIKSE